MPGNDTFEMNDLLSNSGSSSGPGPLNGALGEHQAAADASSYGSKGNARRRSNAASHTFSTSAERLAREEHQLAEKSFWHGIVVNTSLIALWFLFSISITVYNKWMFNNADGKQEVVFPFPLFTTCVHMLVQFSLATLVLYLVPRLRPSHSHNIVNPHAPAHVRHEPRDPSEPIMTRWFYLSRIGPCGIATGLDIGLGNMSFKFITLTFYTMCKSSVLAFVLIFAFLFRLEKPSWRLAGIITMMTLGVVMMVAGEAAFNLIGFFLIMTSAASSGFRWSLTQILLIRHPATSNPFSSIFFLAPIMFGTLFLIAVPVEGFPGLFAAFAVLAEAKGSFGAIAILLFPGCLAFCMTASEFALLKRTSVVTLSICGIFKEVLTISTASIVFHDQLTPINGLGLGVTICTIAAYNYIKIKAMRDEINATTHDAFEHGQYAPIAGLDDEDLESALGEGADEDATLLSNSTMLSGGSVSKLGKTKAEGLMANSLNGLNVSAGSSRAALDSPTKASRTKRPEDLE